MNSTTNRSKNFPILGIKTDNDFDNIELFVDAFNHQTTIGKELLAANYAYFNFEESRESNEKDNYSGDDIDEEDFLKEKLLYLQHVGAKFDLEKSLELLGIKE